MSHLRGKMTLVSSEQSFYVEGKVMGEMPRSRKALVR